MMIHFFTGNGSRVCYDSGFRKGRFESRRLVMPVWKGQSALGIFFWLWSHVHLWTESALETNHFVKAGLVLVMIEKQAGRKLPVRAEASKTLLVQTCMFFLIEHART